MSDGERLDALVRGSVKIEVEPLEYGGVRFVGSDPIVVGGCDDPGEYHAAAVPEETL